MASYTQKQKDAIINYIDNTFKYVNNYARDDIKNAALKAMSESSEQDTDISDVIIDYINEHYSCFNNPVLAESLQVVPKTRLIVSRNEIMETLDDPPYDINIITSCGSTAYLDENANPDDPVVITCEITGGNDPEGKPVNYTLTSVPSDNCIIEKISERKFKVTFHESGMYVLHGMSKEKYTKKQYAINSTTVKVHKAYNQPPNNLSISLSCGSTLKLGSSNTAQTIVATVTGGNDPEGENVIKTVECSTAKNIEKTSNTTWNITFATTGIHVIIASSADPTGLKVVETMMLKVEGQSSSSSTSTGQFAGSKFDSGWTDLVSGCYIDGVTFSLAIGSGHSSSNDYLVILGKKTNGAVVILRDKFNSSNRFKAITPGTEVANSVYSRGNLRSDTHSWTNDPYTLEDDIRQVRFICETPNHESCASGARISYQMSYMYSSTLI